MKSGIYCLTFKNGEKYVGRSIDIERRWAEHAEKLRNGKAAKSLQAAFDRYGYPSAKILMLCHSDHCDLMESYFICKLQPELNSVGGIAVSASEFEVLEQHPNWLQYSTVEHLNKMMEYELDIEKLRNDNKEHVNALEKKIKKLENYIEQERIAADVNNELKTLKQENIELYQEQEELVEELDRIKSKNLWQRIFKW